MAYFPLYIDINEKRCVVVGGGKVATGKIRQLLEFGAAVTVVAPEVTEEIRRLAESGRITLEQKVIFEEETEIGTSAQEQTAGLAEIGAYGQEAAGGIDSAVRTLIENSTLVVAATDQPAVNVSISRLCKEKHIPVNVVDEKELCTFFFPAIIKREDVVVAVSTGGTSPALAARLRRELEEAVPEEYGRAAAVMGTYREYVKERVPDIRDRKRVFEALLSYAVEEAEVRREDVDRILMEQYRIPESIRIGTRGSLLALAQTDLFIEQLQKHYPGISCEKVILKTAGDKILDKPLLEFGGKAVFVTEFEDAIKEGRIDYAVHSAKDMPMELSEGLTVACVLPREDARDVLVTRKGTKLAELKEAVIGTGSLRRQSQLLALYPNAVCRSLRGNVPTRLEKLKAGAFDGIILAAAGLKRLCLDACEEYEYTYLDLEDMVPAGGQAIVAIEGRSGKEQEFLKAVTDEKAALELQAERLILKGLNAGCHEAVGVYAEILDGPGCSEEQMRIRLMKEIDGQIFRTEGVTTLADWKALAERLADEVLTAAARQ